MHAEGGAAATLKAGTGDAVTGLEVQRREAVLGKQPFGSAGAYEKIAGTIRFAADPDHRLHRGITDIGLAPRHAAGRVEFSADFYLLKPVDMRKGNG
ncbi:MAG: alpha/beta hydrolase domain-containing protein, partial [Burkholderiales bacterium]